MNIKKLITTKNLILLLSYFLLTGVVIKLETELVYGLSNAVNNYPIISSNDAIALFILAVLIFFSRILQIVNLLTISKNNAVKIVNLIYEDIIGLRKSSVSNESKEILDGTNYIQPFIISSLQIMGNFLIVSSMIVSFVYSQNLVIPSLVWVIVVSYLILNLLIRVKQKVFGGYVSRSFGKRYRLFQDVIKNAFPIKNYSMDKFYIKKLYEIENDIRKKQVLIYIFAMFPKVLMDMMVVFLFLLIVWNGTMAKEQLALLAFLGIRLLPYLTQIFLNISKISALSPVVAKFFRTLDQSAIADDLKFSNPKYDDNLIITGSSGGGKSTLLFNMFGMEKGEVLNQSLFSRAQKKYIFFQQKAPALDIDVKTFILLNKLNTDLIKKFLLYDIIETKLMSELSGGELQRFWLCATFSKGKEILIFDEPTNNLDDTGQDIFVEMIKKESRKVIIVSHDKVLVKKCLDLGYERKIID
jgi:ABC-type lipoprotein export system ATPase subunit